MSTDYTSNFAPRVDSGEINFRGHRCTTTGGTANFGAPDQGNFWAFSRDTSTSHSVVQWLNDSGLVCANLGDGTWLNSTGDYDALSDERRKQNIRDAPSQWDDIKRLRVRKYYTKEDVRQNGKQAQRQLGLVAQEVENVSPGLVSVGGEDTGGFKAIKYSVLYLKAAKALQEALGRIEELEALIEEAEQETF